MSFPLVCGGGSGASASSASSAITDAEAGKKVVRRIQEMSPSVQTRIIAFTFPCSKASLAFILEEESIQTEACVRFFVEKLGIPKAGSYPMIQAYLEKARMRLARTKRIIDGETAPEETPVSRREFTQNLQTLRKELIALLKPLNEAQLASLNEEFSTLAKPALLACLFDQVFLHKHVDSILKLPAEHREDILTPLKEAACELIKKKDFKRAEEIALMMKPAAQRAPGPLSSIITGESLELGEDHEHLLAMPDSLLMDAIGAIYLELAIVLIQEKRDVKSLVNFLVKLPFLTEEKMDLMGLLRFSFYREFTVRGQVPKALALLEEHYTHVPETPSKRAEKENESLVICCALCEQNKLDEAKAFVLTLTEQVCRGRGFQLIATRIAETQSVSNAVAFVQENIPDSDAQQRAFYGVILALQENALTETITQMMHLTGLDEE